MTGSMGANLQKVFEHYWFKVIKDTEEVVKLLRDDFIPNGLPLNDKLKSLFLDEVNTRYANVFGYSETVGLFIVKLNSLF